MTKGEAIRIVEKWLASGELDGENGPGIAAIKRLLQEVKRDVSK